MLLVGVWGVPSRGCGASVAPRSAFPPFWRIQKWALAGSDRNASISNQGGIEHTKRDDKKIASFRVATVRAYALVFQPTIIIKHIIVSVKGI